MLNEYIRKFYNNELDLTTGQPIEAVEEFFGWIKKVNIEELISLADEFGSKYTELGTSDIPQFSTLDMVDEVVNILTAGLDETITMPLLGYYLRRDDSLKHEAKRKYGENHGNLAVLMGLANYIGRGYVKTDIADYYLKLQNEDKHLVRNKLLFRIKYIQRMLWLSGQGEVNAYKIMNNLSTGTMKRRGQSIRRINEELCGLENTHLTERISRIYWEV